MRRTRRSCHHAAVARTVVIVDDHAGFRLQATRLLQDAGYQVVGSCGDGASALAAIAAMRPDVVLLDVQLPDIDGFAVMSKLATPEPPTFVLISSREAGDYGSRIGGCGAAGFITKSDLSARSLAEIIGAQPG